jgi:hypothetical protein
MDTEEEDYDEGMSETCADATEPAVEEPMSVEIDHDRATSMEVSDKDGNSDKSMASPPELEPVVPAEVDESEAELEQEQDMKSAAASPGVHVEAASVDDSNASVSEPVVETPDESTVVEEEGTTFHRVAVSESGLSAEEDEEGSQHEGVVSEVTEDAEETSTQEEAGEWSV